jgi:hypothetical protein
MVLKIFRVVWFVSVVVVFTKLLYHYAGWQETLVIQEAEGSQVTMNKEVLFYVLVLVIALINVLVYLTSKVYKRQEDLRAWFHGLITTINIFFVIALTLIATYNSTEAYDFSRAGFIVYGSVALMGLWALAWPAYLLFQKFFVKQAV